MPDGRYNWVHVRHPVNAERNLVGILRDGLTAITEPDRPVVMRPCREAANDVLPIQVMLGPQLLTLPARLAAARGGVPISDDAQEGERIVGKGVKKTGYVIIEPSVV